MEGCSHTHLITMTSARAFKQTNKGFPPQNLESTWSTWSAVSNLTSRAGELRSAPSGPDDRYRVAGKRALALGGARGRTWSTWSAIINRTSRAALGALGVRLLTAHAGPGSSEAHPAGRMIGILRIFPGVGTSCLGGPHDEILHKPWPAPAVPLPTYLPTYPTYGKLKKKSLAG